MLKLTVSLSEKYNPSKCPCNYRPPPAANFSGDHSTRRLAVRGQITICLSLIIAVHRRSCLYDESWTSARASASGGGAWETTVELRVAFVEEAVVGAEVFVAAVSVESAAREASAIFGNRNQRSIISLDKPSDYCQGERQRRNDVRGDNEIPDELRIQRSAELEIQVKVIETTYQ